MGVACSVEGQRHGKIGSGGSRPAYSIIGPVQQNQGHMLGTDGTLMVGNDDLTRWSWWCRNIGLSRDIHDTAPIKQHASKDHSLTNFFSSPKTTS